MGTLKEILNEFENQVIGVTKEEELQKIFKDLLAPAFLYGGYIQVRNDYEVYIRTVEFYFHSEKDGIHDPIVYHRNNRYIEGEVPYFPKMFLHAHASGFDITFENEGKYRASALIRSYEVKEAKNKDAKNKDVKYLIWDKEKEMFVKSEKYGYNTQSTYLYTLLNGFSLIENDNDIKWQDKNREYSKDSIEERKRQNVYQFDAEGKKVKCTRKWSFTRKEQV